MSAQQDEIRRLIAEKRDAISANLEAFFSRNMEDLVAAGMAQGSVAKAAFRAGLLARLLAEGPHATIKELRHFADSLEKQVGHAN
jgi:hypothetical protein